VQKQLKGSLRKSGGEPILFEASNRWGGRVFTRYDFYKGMHSLRSGTSSS